MLKVAVSFRFGLRYLWLKEPTGREEFELSEGHPLALAQALSRLMVSMQPAEFRQLSLADRDRILAAVYLHCFGDNVESILRCARCDKTYELGFSLGEFLSELDTSEEKLLTPDAQGVFTLSPQVRFRLPTVADEILAAELPPVVGAQLLRQRCLVEGDLERDSSVIEEQLQLLAPLLRTRLGSSCPHCEHPHTIDFDLVSYSQRCFQRDQAMLTREIHCLGSAYRFGYEEILGMPRSVRQELVTLLLGQRSRGAA
jgi:uncharacterized metal-binding protein YceD (DUF177 family)